MERGKNTQQRKKYWKFYNNLGYSLRTGSVEKSNKGESMTPEKDQHKWHNVNNREKTYTRQMSIPGSDWTIAEEWTGFWPKNEKRSSELKRKRLRTPQIWWR